MQSETLGKIITGSLQLPTWAIPSLSWFNELSVQMQKHSLRRICRNQLFHYSTDASRKTYLAEGEGRDLEKQVSEGSLFLRGKEFWRIWTDQKLGLPHNVVPDSCGWLLPTGLMHPHVKPKWREKKCVNRDDIGNNSTSYHLLSICQALCRMFYIYYL